jgi:hypothetical protein
MSSTSTTTVVTKPKRAGRPAKTAVAKSSGSPVASKIATKSTASKVGGALKATANAKGANKKVVVAEPAAGRRVLRKRN